MPHVLIVDNMTLKKIGLAILDILAIERGGMDEI
jgi:hypothetical protein